ncbi:amidohydrolase family protein [Lolliginicoccus levis]|uniref:amidohydrolase family protein n=1 Tax=Lolliginicoccus levis TaxID=2919542 RepID=UPI00241E13CB|nr:amidohydrolase family protein [Lolliginicoccus levis]
MGALHLHGITLPDEQSTDLWIVDGKWVREPVPKATTIVSDGWITPGLVDAHCHIGIRFGGGHETAEGAREQASVEARAGVLLARDAGSPIPTRFLDDEEAMPRIIRAGRHIAAPKRYIRDLGIDVENEKDLPDEVRRQARAGDGWVKLVGDWIDRGTGDLAPLWSREILREAIAAAHEEGARVTAHVFGEDALPDLLDAGIDCIEHGTGLTASTIDQMARDGIALVPTMVNIDNFPSIADSASRFPAYAAHMRDLHARVGHTVRDAVEAGVPVYTGTDAGGMVEHGRIADEIDKLREHAMTTEQAIAAASWSARDWLGADTAFSAGERADAVVYLEDPRSRPQVLRHPVRILCAGTVVA